MDLSERSDPKYRHPWELSRTGVLINELRKLKIHGRIKGRKFDFVLLMDVLEHMEDDVLFMRSLQQYAVEAKGR